MTDTAISAAAMDDTAEEKKLDEDMAKNRRKKNPMNAIQVSNTKKPLFFYLNLAKKRIKQHNDIHLSAVGMAIPTAIIIAEYLKNNGLALEKQVSTSTVDSKNGTKDHSIRKAKIEIVLVKTETVVDNPKTAPAAATVQTA